MQSAPDDRRRFRLIAGGVIGGLALVLVIALIASSRGAGTSDTSDTSSSQTWYQHGHQFGSAAATHGTVTKGTPINTCLSLQVGITGPPWSSTYQAPDGTSIAYHAPLATDDGGSHAWMTGCVAGLSGR
jgi:hypothetical protein